MKKITIIAALLFVLLATGCAAGQETIVETVVVEQTVEVPVTVEVTRPVEVAVEVTRVVKVTREVPVEVTRIVESLITATPTATPIPLATNTPAPAVADAGTSAPAPAAQPTQIPDLAGALLQASLTLQSQAISFGEALGGGNCEEIVRLQDGFLAAPSFDVTGAHVEVQYAYGHYQAALELLLDAALGIGQGCREAIQTQTSFTITHLNYIDIQSKIEQAKKAIEPGISKLEALMAS